MLGNLCLVCVGKLEEGFFHVKHAVLNTAHIPRMQRHFFRMTWRVNCGTSAA